MPPTWRSTGCVDFLDHGAAAVRAEAEIPHDIDGRADRDAVAAEAQRAAGQTPGAVTKTWFQTDATACCVSERRTDLHQGHRSLRGHSVRVCVSGEAGRVEKPGRRGNADAVKGLRVRAGEVAVDAERLRQSSPKQPVDTLMQKTFGVGFEQSDTPGRAPTDCTAQQVRATSRWCRSCLCCSEAENAPFRPPSA